MGRLISFGCSYVYGHGLQDCFIPPTDYGPKPSKLSFAQIIADNFNAEHINKAFPGTSNKNIINEILNTEWKDNDVALIGWTHVSRTCIIKNKEVQHLGNWADDNQSKNYFKYMYDPHNILWETKLYMNYSNLYLKNKKISVINLKGYDDDLNIDWHNLAQESNIEIFDKNIMDVYVDKALDSNHPGTETHKKYANEIIKEYRHVFENN